jgi:hypothetical protein
MIISMEASFDQDEIAARMMMGACIVGGRY